LKEGGREGGREGVLAYLLPLGESTDEAEHAHAGLRAAVGETNHLHGGDGVDDLGREGGREGGL
jgi:hypothetical protein